MDCSPGTGSPAAAAAAAAAAACLLNSVEWLDAPSPYRGGAKHAR